MTAVEFPGIMPDRSPSSVTLQRGKSDPLWQSFNPKANLAKSVKDRRRFKRVNISLLGRYMRENKQEYPCQIVNMSAGGTAVRASIAGDMGERIVIYLDILGRIEGDIVRLKERKTSGSTDDPLGEFSRLLVANTYPDIRDTYFSTARELDELCDQFCNEPGQLAISPVRVPEFD